jgi:predicted ABC-type ATPase
MIPEWQAAGYRVKLIFLSLPSGEMAIDRVARAREKARQTGTPLVIFKNGHIVKESIMRIESSNMAKRSTDMN